MARAYIPPPSKEALVLQFAEWIAHLFRVDVTITISDKVGAMFTVNIDNPDKAPND